MIPPVDVPATISKYFGNGFAAKILPFNFCEIGGAEKAADTTAIQR